MAAYIHPRQTLRDSHQDALRLDGFVGEMDGHILSYPENRKRLPKMFWPEAAAGRGKNRQG